MTIDYQTFLYFKTIY